MCQQLVKILIIVFKLCFHVAKMLTLHSTFHFTGLGTLMYKGDTTEMGRPFFFCSDIQYIQLYNVAVGVNQASLKDSVTLSILKVTKSSTS